MKFVRDVIRNVEPHWVGDGFPVRSLFTYADGNRFDPFLLLDYAGPYRFEPGPVRRGVGEHPHRGFETVTIVSQGEVEHRDSAGSHGTIGPGDVQWMTAAAGVVHEEFHSERFTRSGGIFELVQLWVNLPARHKMSAPRYQSLLSTSIPVVPLRGGAGTARVIAGRFADAVGPAATMSPVNLWELQFAEPASVSIDLPDGQTSLVLVQNGSVRLSGTQTNAVELAVLDQSGSQVQMDVDSAAKLLILTGEPLNEPIVGQGPFVMNTREEIQQAISDYRAGRMGRLS